MNMKLEVDVIPKIKISVHEKTSQKQYFGLIWG